MIRRTLAELAAPVLEATVIGDPWTVVSGIEYDSRRITSGDLFAALRGSDVDGHVYAELAVGSGAVALLVEEPLDISVPQIVVAESRRNLALVAATFYGHPSRELDVIGVTGTDGKTTTTFLIDGLLRHAGLRTGLIGTVEVRIGDETDRHTARQTTPESSEIQRLLRRMVSGGVEWVSLEATSHGLDLHRLDHTRFRIAAVTNVTHEHMEHHKTVEAYRRAKAVLFERTAADGGTAVINLDDAGARSMLAYVTGIESIGYTRAGHASARLTAQDLKPRADGTTFTLRWDDSAVRVELPLVGEFNVENALCAAGVGLAAGLSLEAVADGLRRAPVIPGRMSRVDAGQPFAVVVDYAHTPASLESQLKLLRGLYPDGRILCVSGSAGERDATKRPMQGAVSARLADLSIFTSEDPRNEDPDTIIAEIAAGAQADGAVCDVSFYCVTDRRAAIRLAFSLAKPGDCVLLAGKGHEGSIIWAGEKRWWDETIVAQQELGALGFEVGVSG